MLLSLLLMDEKIYLILEAGGKEKKSFMVYWSLIWWLFINNLSKSSLALGFRETLRRSPPAAVSAV